MAKTIFIDVDGVLADFVGGVRDIFGMPDDWHPKEYDFSKYIGKSWATIIKMIANERSFWQDLIPYPDGAAFLERLLEIDKNKVVPLTKPMKGADNFFIERDAWLTKTFPALVNYPIFAVDKSFIAGPDKLLIDDSDENVEDWRAAGGTAILWPRPWNVAGIDGPDERTRIMMLDQVQRFTKNLF